MQEEKFIQQKKNENEEDEKKKYFLIKELLNAYDFIFLLSYSSVFSLIAY